MPDFTISCETFARLAVIVEGYEPPVNRQSLKSVFVEIKNGHMIAASCCSTLMAVEYIGTTEQPDAIINLTIDPVLVNQCRTEAPFKSSLFVNSNELLKYATLKTSLGYVYPGNAAIWDFGHNWLADFRERIPKEVYKKSSGAMFWYVERVRKLAQSAPSGKIVFPEFFHTNKAMVLRDPVYSNWFGMFIPEPNDNDKCKLTFQDEAGKIPEWVFRNE